MTYLVDPNKAFSGDQGASNLLGDLHRASFSDWKARFAPEIENLAAMATDSSMPAEAAAQSMSAVGQSFDNSRRALTMKLNGLGLQMDSTERAANDRRFALAEAATKASTANQSRTTALDMQQQILAGDMGTQNLPSSALQNLRG